MLIDAPSHSGVQNAEHRLMKKQFDLREMMSTETIGKISAVVASLRKKAKELGKARINDTGQ